GRAAEYRGGQKREREELPPAVASNHPFPPDKPLLLPSLAGRPMDGHGRCPPLLGCHRPRRWAIQWMPRRSLSSGRASRGPVAGAGKIGVVRLNQTHPALATRDRQKVIIL